MRHPQNGRRIFYFCDAPLQDHVRLCGPQQCERGQVNLMRCCFHCHSSKEHLCLESVSRFRITRTGSAPSA